jgi:CRP-like cAMP-binding protein
MDERIVFLRQVPFFKEMLLKEIATIALYCRTRTYLRDSVILTEGAPGKGLFIIKKGMVEITKKTPHGEEKISLLRENEFFGEMSLIEQVPASATVYAAEDDTELLHLEPAMFHQLLETEHKVAVQLLIVIAKILSHRLRELEKKGIISV